MIWSGDYLHLDAIEAHNCVGTDSKFSLVEQHTTVIGYSIAGCFNLSTCRMFQPVNPSTAYKMRNVVKGGYFSTVKKTMMSHTMCRQRKC